MKKPHPLAMGLMLSLLFSCSSGLPWPSSPLYDEPLMPQTGMEGLGSGSVALQPYPQSREEAVAAIAGRYAHYDVVAYEDLSTRTPMRTFILSYGFTTFHEEDGRLYQSNEFLYADYLLNQSSVETSISPAAVQAIKARSQEVQLSLEDGLWRIYRSETPVLLGIEGDPDLPLSRDPQDPRIIDADNDGKPGVTVNITIGGFIRGEIYITRREIYRNYLTLYPDGRLIGWVEDLSEQFVIDANMGILRQPSHNVQLPDPGMNPMYLVPIDDGIDTLQEFLQIRDQLFPAAPEFLPE